MGFTTPTPADFKSRFDRDFGFASDQTDMTRVRDKDINLGLTQAGMNFNEDFFATQATFAEAFLLLSAHYLCTNLKNSSQGLGSSGEWLTNSKAAGSVNESYTIPEWIAKDPSLAVLTKTGYGMEYLSLILPFLVGNTAVLCRTALPV